MFGKKKQNQDEALYDDGDEDDNFSEEKPQPQPVKPSQPKQPVLTIEEMIDVVEGDLVRAITRFRILAQRVLQEKQE